MNIQFFVGFIVLVIIGAIIRRLVYKVMRGRGL